jgi:hypothetical protein
MSQSSGVIVPVGINDNTNHGLSMEQNKVLPRKKYAKYGTKRRLQCFPHYQEKRDQDVGSR